MKTIKYKSKLPLKINIGKIKPFFNICKVSGKKEECNIEVEYIPNDTLIELESYREKFTKDFNLYIEELAELIFEMIWNSTSPKYLKVIIFLEEESLTPWSVTIEKWENK